MYAEAQHSSSPGPGRPVFRFQLNHVDYTQQAPGPFDPKISPLGTRLGQTFEFSKVPVLRAFGSSDSGQMVCAHFHGVYPYMFIEYTGSLDKDVVDNYITQLVTSINEALRESYRHSRDKTFVANILLCKAVPFYGYSVGWRYFLKIYLLGPSMMTRLADLLRNASILATSFVVYEAHNPYIAQFMIDFNLFGCGWINLNDVRFRSPVPDQHAVKAFEWTSQTISSYRITNPDLCPRASHCELEIDIQAQWIANRLEIRELNLHHDFIERTSPIPNDYRFMHSVAELWKDEQSRRKTRKVGRKSVPVVSPNEPRTRSKWSKEDEFREKVLRLVESDMETGSEASFDKYCTYSETENSIPRAFEVIGTMFFPDRLASTTTQSSQNYDQSFWETVDSEELKLFEEKVKQQLEPIDNGELMASQKLLKRKKIDTSSSGSPQTSSPLMTSSELLSSKSAIGRGSVVNHGNSEQAPNGSHTLRRSLSMLEYWRSSKPASHIDNSASSQGAKKRRTAEPDMLPISHDDSSEANTVSVVSPGTTSTFGVSDEHRQLSIAQSIKNSFQVNGHLWMISRMPVKSSEILNSLVALGMPRIEYRDAYYSKPSDVPSRAREYGGKQFRLQGITTPYLSDFLTGFVSPDSSLAQKLIAGSNQECTFRYWQIAARPPSRSKVNEWLAMGKSVKAIKDKKLLSQIDSPTQRPMLRSSEGAKKVYNLTATTMSVMSLETHVNTPSGLLPNPARDAITFVVYDFQPSSVQQRLVNSTGIIVVADDEVVVRRLSKLYSSDTLTIVSDELELIELLIKAVRDLDPDIFTGYEVQNLSWGYVIKRASAKYYYDLCDEFSRMIEAKTATTGGFDRWGYQNASTLKITGRHVLNIWRVLRGSVSLLQYTMQNCAFTILNKRVPFYSNDDLTEWFKSQQSGQMLRVLRHYTLKARLNLEFLKDQETIERTSEQARILGVDFFSVISRGSQFKVESLMFRIAKAENFMLVSPSRRQVGHQNALECLPLVMEPKSRYYSSPVVVLDFQALYPSLIIAYNYCYSTCLGRVDPWLGRNKLGVLDLDLPKGLLALLKDDLTISPNGLIFVRPAVRRSLLARMLSEVLDTRVMVKSEMKDTESESLKKILNNRQLALKLFANVTYGYTSASFSGRMPCAEIADAIVQSGRELLERSIELINTTSKWGAEVVYGDTDSLFIHLPGRSKDQAFDIGKEIAETITGMNPQPIKLKLEKVYMGCILQTKKRYVGSMYESKDQTEPTFDAKGMETVRRDGTPAEQKIEEKALKTSDLSAVKEYIQDQCRKIMGGNVSIHEFCFAKEVRMGTYSERGTLPPGAMLSAQKMQNDPRAEPQYGERVPYVVISGPQGSRLVDRCVSPETLLNDSNLFLDADYYITKNILPPLERIFNLVGANVRSWYDEMPKLVRIPYQLQDSDALVKRSTIHSYMKSSLCIVCQTNDAAEDSVCAACRKDAASSHYIVKTRGMASEVYASKLVAICRSCTGVSGAEDVACLSQDCPVYFARVKSISKAKYAKKLSAMFESLALDW